MFIIKYKNLLTALFFTAVLLASVIVIPTKTFGEVVAHGGEEFQVNAYTDNEQSLSSVSLLNNGNFVVAWSSIVVSSREIYAQIFDGLGAKVGNEFQINTCTVNSQNAPYVAALSNGNFVVVWHSSGGSSCGYNSSSYGVYGQVVDATGTKIGDEFQVNTYTNDNQWYPVVAALNNGNLVVVWASDGQDGSEYGIYAQIFNGVGVKLGDEFRVNTYTDNDQDCLARGISVLSGGNFVVAWASNGQDGSGKGIYAQIFSENGMKIGNEFQVNTYITNSQTGPAISSFNDGNFVVVWSSSGQDGSGEGIYAQIFSENGMKVGNEFQVNTYAIGSQSYSAVDVLKNGN